MSAVRKVFLAVLVLGVMLFAYIAILQWWLPNTPEGWFTYHTGLPFPANATIIEHSLDYTVGIVETFSSEGTSVFVFSTDAETLEAWLNSNPPWQATWTRGEVPLWVNEKRPAGTDVAFVMRGDRGNGKLLALDIDTNTVWLFGWNY